MKFLKHLNSTAILVYLFLFCFFGYSHALSTMKTKFMKESSPENKRSSSESTKILGITFNIVLKSFLDKSFILNVAFNLRYNKVLVFLSTFIGLVIGNSISLYIDFNSIYLDLVLISFLFSSGLVYILTSFNCMCNKAPEEPSDTPIIIMNQNQQIESNNENLHSEFLLFSRGLNEFFLFLYITVLTILCEVGIKTQLSIIYINSSTTKHQLLLCIFLSQLLLCSIGLGLAKFIQNFQKDEFSINSKSIDLLLGILLMLLSFLSICLVILNCTASSKIDFTGEFKPYEIIPQKELLKRRTFHD